MVNFGWSWFCLRVCDICCCFIYQQLLSSPDCELPFVWWVGSLRPLLPPEDQGRVFGASCGAVGSACAGESFQVTSKCRRRVLVGDLCADSSHQSWDILIEGRYPPGGSAVPGAIHKLCAVYRGFRSNIRQGINCFCPANVIGEGDHAPLHLLGLMLDGLMEKGGSETAT